MSIFHVPASYVSLPEGISSIMEKSAVKTYEKVHELGPHRCEPWEHLLGPWAVLFFHGEIPTVLPFVLAAQFWPIQNLWGC